ncbi:Asparaginase [Popillia japonica]|uniref:Asparaginase n=1 Tax=Popillia japonica TaxID=7064 RepID=A0AAW1LSM6_POPJA
MEPVLLVHGGAGEIPNDQRAQELLEGVKHAAKEGYKVLKANNSLLDAVETAVRILEDNEMYNAGKGSVLNLDGEVEMDASIMVGSDLSAGAVTIVKDVKNAITLARRVMEKTPHFMLAGEGALRFAKEQGLEILPPGALVTQAKRERLELIKARLVEKRAELGTVGAVAACNGHVVAATSTGGYEGKMVGRSSDTCVLGSGTYADDALGAVSTTGHGESIAKFCLAYAILKEIEKGKNVQDATTYSIEKMTEKLKNTAGAITVTPKGEVGIGFSSNRMTWAYQIGDELHFGVNKNDHRIEKV